MTKRQAGPIYKHDVDIVTERWGRKSLREDGGLMGGILRAIGVPMIMTNLHKRRWMMLHCNFSAQPIHYLTLFPYRGNSEYNRDSGDTRQPSEHKALKQYPGNLFNQFDLCELINDVTVLKHNDWPGRLVRSLMHQPRDHNVYGTWDVFFQKRLRSLI